MLEQIQAKLPAQDVNVIFEQVADDMVPDLGLTDYPWDARMEMAVDYLNEHGYEARWEMVNGECILHTSNCPYHHVAHSNEALCGMDLHLVSSLLGVVPRLVSRISDGDQSCSYLIPDKSL